MAPRERRRLSPGASWTAGRDGMSETLTGQRPGTSARYDAVVVGSGPNGLAAAITLARAGCSVCVLEADDDIGGGTRSAELTLPGFVHDVCSAIHPLAASSPFLSQLPLTEHGLEWAWPEVALAHPLDDGSAGFVASNRAATADALGRDAASWRRTITPLADRWQTLAPMLLGPLLRPPAHPLTLARFAIPAGLPASALARVAFREPRTRALASGCAAHSILPIDRPLTGSFSLLLLASAEAVGWPAARGGSRAIGEALARYLRSLGGETVTGRRVTSLAELPPSRVVLFDVSPRQVVEIAGDQLPARYVRRLLHFRHGPAVFKVDYALDAPVPWRAEVCRRAGTVHVGGTLAEVARAEDDVAHGRHPEHPFVLVAQQSVFDASRAPSGKHTLWAYCHVPNGSDVDMTDAIERQISRFAPGFRDTVLARHVAGPAWFERHDAAYVGGDIAGGAHSGRQLLFRPTMQLHPYRTPNPRLFICSASTPPGAGVHGMSGYHAATDALRAMRVPRPAGPLT